MDCFGAYPPSTTIQTCNGKIEGKRMIHNGPRQVDVFLGIPYAKPPVGELRFKKPMVLDPWEEVLSTREYRARSIQRNFYIWDNIKKGKPSEDCLYLNVFMPCWSPPSTGFPVMVFIHGGSFVMDGASNYGDIEICRNIVSRDTIFVSIQYRVGYLGFWTTGDDACPGNNGLWDQCEALKWINKNIDKFEGDPNNITLIGQGAGAASIDLLHLSPISSKLFHKMILLSGNAYAPWCFSTLMKEQCDAKAKSMGVFDCTTSYETLDRLRKISADEFTVNRGDEGGNSEGGTQHITPVLDGFFLAENVGELRKKAKPKPLLTGVTRLEALMFVNGSLVADANTLETFVRSLITSQIEDQEKIYESLYRRYLPPGLLANKSTFLRGVVECERVDQRRMSIDDVDSVLAAARVLSDRFINTPTLKLAKETLQRKEAPVYLYTFDFLNSKSLGLARFWMSIVEASHGSELPYFFGTGISWKFTFNTDDIEMTHLVAQAFTNFAKCSDPNGLRPHDALPVKWNELTTIRPTSHFVFGKRPKMSDDFFLGRPLTLLEMDEEPPQPGFS